MQFIVFCIQMFYDEFVVMNHIDSEIVISLTWAAFV